MHRVLGKVFADLLPVEGFEFRDNRLELRGAEVRVLLGGGLSLWRSKVVSKRRASTSLTIRPNIAMSRRYASHANRSFAVRARASTVVSLRPRFRTVSIIPGIESLAPERTETSSGCSEAPNFRPPFTSTADRASSTCFHIPGGNRPVRGNALQAFVVIVKPGGTGRPSRVISARPAPLPPRRARMEAFPSSNGETCFPRPDPPRGSPQLI